MLSSSFSSGVSNSTLPYMGPSQLQPLPPLFVPSIPPESSFNLTDTSTSNSSFSGSEFEHYFIVNSSAEVQKQYKDLILIITETLSTAQTVADEVIDMATSNLITRYMERFKKKDTSYQVTVILNLLTMMINIGKLVKEINKTDSDKLLEISNKLLKALTIDDGTDFDIYALINEASQFLGKKDLQPNCKHYAESIILNAEAHIGVRTFIRGYRNYLDTNTGEFVHGDKTMFGFGRHKKKTRRNNRTSRKKLKKRRTRKTIN